METEEVFTMAGTTVERLLAVSQWLLIVVLTITVPLSIAAVTMVGNGDDHQLTDGLTYLGTITNRERDSRYRLYSLSDQEPIPSQIIMIARTVGPKIPDDYRPSVPKPETLSKLDDLTILTASAALISTGTFIGAIIYYAAIRRFVRHSLETTFL